MLHKVSLFSRKKNLFCGKNSTLVSCCRSKIKIDAHVVFFRCTNCRAMISQMRFWEENVLQEWKEMNELHNLL